MSKKFFAPAKVPYGWRLIYPDLGFDSFDNMGKYTPVNTKTGSNNPLYQRVIDSLGDATYPYTRAIHPVVGEGFFSKIQPVAWSWVNKDWRYSPSPGWYNQTVQVFGYPQTFGLYPFVSMDYDPRTFAKSLDSLAKLAFLGKIREAVSSFDALPFIGELRETIGMLRHPLRGFTKTTYRYRSEVRALKRVHDQAMRSLGYLPPALRAQQVLLQAKILSDKVEKAFLQWTYGVSPLLNDVESITDTVSQMQSEPEVKRLSVTLSSERPVAGSTELWTYNGHAQFNRTTMESLRYRTSIRGAVFVGLEPPGSLGRLQELTRFDLMSFVPSVYELLPYSFLVDYFSTLGQVVNGVFTSTRRLVYAAHTRKIECMNTGFAIPLPGTPRPVSWPLRPSTATLRGVRLNREKPDLSVSLSDLQITMPSLGQWLNSAVLATQKVRHFED